MHLSTRRMPQPWLMEPAPEVPPSDPALLRRWAYFLAQLALVRILRGVFSDTGQLLKQIKANGGRPRRRPVLGRGGA